MASTTYKATFDNMLSTINQLPPLQLKIHNIVKGVPSYGSRQAVYPGTTSSPDAIQILDNGQFKPWIGIHNVSSASTAALGLEIGMGDGNYYKLYDFIYTNAAGFLSIVNSEIPIYLNGDDVTLWVQRGGGGQTAYEICHAEYHKNA